LKVRLGVGLTAGVALALALALARALADGEVLGVGLGVGVGVGAGVGVTTNGVYDGHGGRGGTGGWWAPVSTSEIATAMAPMRTVRTKVMAPHSRRKRLMR
jgi:hypothetical protein